MSKPPREATAMQVVACECCGAVTVWLLDAKDEPFAVGRWPKESTPALAKYLCDAVDEHGLGDAHAKPPAVRQ